MDAMPAYRRKNVCNPRRSLVRAFFAAHSLCYLSSALAGVVTTSDVGAEFYLPISAEAGTTHEIVVNFEIPLLAKANVGSHETEILEKDIRQCISAAKYGIFASLHVVQDEKKTNSEAARRDMFSPQYDKSTFGSSAPDVLIFSQFSPAFRGDEKDDSVRAIMKLDRDVCDKFLYRWKITAGARVVNVTNPEKHIAIQTKFALLIQRRSVAEPDSFYKGFPNLEIAQQKDLTNLIQDRLTESAIQFLEHSSLPVDLRRLPLTREH